MGRYDFKLKTKSKINTFRIWVEYMGGDADTYHNEYYELPDVDAETMNVFRPQINELVRTLKKLGNILDVNNSEYLECYDDVLEKHGREVADMYDDVPGDPQCDYQYKTSMSEIRLQYFDDNGNLWEGGFV